MSNNLSTIIVFQAITVLNHAGICLSYNAIWNYFRQLVRENRFLEVVKEGEWMWVYDNLNIHQRVRHERQGMNPSCYNMIVIKWK